MNEEADKQSDRYIIFEIKCEASYRVSDAFFQYRIDFGEVK